MRAKPELTFLQIWNMCFGFMGIQFGFALQNSNVSRIFQTLGASVDDIPVLWIAAPLTGLLVQPLVGYFSDRTWNVLGRRRPYFLAGAILATLALIAMPNSSALWIAAGLLWILDASINVSMEPFRAFVGDQLPSTQRPTGYAMQSFFIGIGSVVASLLPWLFARWGVANTALDGVIPDTVKYAFYAGAGALFGAIAWTILTTREYPPADLAEFDCARADPELAAPPRGSTTAWLWLAAGVAGLAVVYLMHIDKQLYLLAGGMLAFGLLRILVARSRSGNPITDILTDLDAMPATMRRLAVVQFFSWFALFAMWIYTTPAVTGIHFGAKDTSSAAYNDGANWVGVLFAAYNGFAAIAALLIAAMTKRLGLRVTHMINLFLGGAGLISFVFIRDPDWLLLSMAGVGFAWASILSLPYALLADSLPARKMGVYMGIFNFFIVIPQLLAASVLGFLVKTLFGNAPIYALLIGGASLVVAGVCTLFVREQAHG
jgi:maltose/moltooligosaccharide transporter